MKTENRLVVARDLGERKVIANGYEVSFGGNKNIPKFMAIEVQICEYTKN